MHRITPLRIAVVGLLVVLFVTLLAGSVGGDQQRSVGTDFGGHEDILFVTTQGTSTLEGAQSAVRVIDTQTGETRWSHDAYERYFDVEPRSDRVVQFLGADGPHGSNMWVNVVDWKTGERLERFRVPDDTHDVDYLGDDRYAVADKEDHRLYVYDAATGETVWDYVYADHYPESAGGADDFTHVNDIDPVDNSSLFLASPRNFDRVMLLNRSSKENVWTLGAEDEYNVLHEQHNPTLISRSPPTILVADSENNRIVEYQRTDGEWTQVWAYRGSLSWPRDADRLPNGNTLIVDSSNQRVLEVTPGREVVWEATFTKNPYDADLLSFDEEPRGPSMNEFRDQFDGAEAATSRRGGFVGQLRQAVGLLQWVVPWNVAPGDVLLGLSAGGLVIFLTGSELSLHARRRDVAPSEWLPSGTGLFSLVGFAVAVWLLAAPGVDRYSVGIWRGIGVVVLGSSLLSVPDRWLDSAGLRGHRETPVVRPVVAAVGVGLCLALAATTMFNALYLSAAALFTVEGVRHVSSDTLSHPFGNWFVAGGYLVRIGALVPMLGLVYVSRTASLTAVYLGFAVVLVGSAALPHAARARRLARDNDAAAYLLTGGRTVIVVVTLVAAAGLCYNLTQPTTLAGVYVGLAALLLRNAVSLLRT